MDKIALVITLRASEVEKAQKQIIQVIKNLADRGISRRGKKGGTCIGKQGKLSMPNFQVRLLIQGIPEEHVALQALSKVFDIGEEPRGR